MFAYLRGRLAESLPNQVTVDVGGVGYHLLVPLSTYDALPAPGGEVKILTHLIIREDSHTLYGFLTSSERDLFRLLIDRVTGVGPKIAMSVLSAMPVEDFKNAVVRGDLARISKIKGLGKKTAERIVLELKDNVGVTAAWEAAHLTAPPAAAAYNDAVLALINLGYKQAEARQAVSQLSGSAELGAQPTTDQILRAALRNLN